MPRGYTRCKRCRVRTHASDNVELNVPPDCNYVCTHCKRMARYFLPGFQLDRLKTELRSQAKEHQSPADRSTLGDGKHHSVSEGSGCGGGGRKNRAASYSCGGICEKGSRTPHAVGTRGLGRYTPVDELSTMGLKVISIWVYLLMHERDLALR